MTGHRKQAGSGRKPCRTRRAVTGVQAATEAGLEAYVERIVRAAPPFTASQRARIAAILNGAAPSAGRANRTAADHEDGRP
ncbi:MULTISPECIES: hypothetical protein [Saccharothrix]|uniref:hypothetical protein n=1 Tax=Saccharothrix TaxID=2071 RepID=UPI00093F0BDB|nr:hypothetical protein [Saccharothrix sp. CB00851]OKI34585.1 hypothetical protein A6A25_25290 [Saccharothrix sp. CB00851]